MKPSFCVFWVAFALAGPRTVHAQQSVPVEPVYTVVEKMPRFKSTDSSTVALVNYLVRNTRYPVGALQDKASGRVFVSFVVNKDGGVEQAKIVNGGHPALKREALRVVSEMPRWEVPGRQLGQPVSVAFTVPITFNMRMATPADMQDMQDKRRAAVQKQLADAQTELTVPGLAVGDTGPVFSADPLGAANYISRQLQYPLDARRAKKEGVVLVDFVVSVDGKVTDVRVAKGVFPSLDNEALRVVGGMPLWQPGTHGSQAVATPLSGIPVTFRLK